MFQGVDSIGEMRGAPEHLTGTIAIPFMIGLGTVSAAVVTGVSLPIGGAAMIIFLTLTMTCELMILMKFAHDHLCYKHAKYIDHYVDMVGQLSALLIGTIVLDMIINGTLGVISEM